ncbi:protein kinase [Actinocorallia sp. B10E7]|uniref:serine/threonine protein kinase n=1 Tax=Actinocorallia sp. B10E7 TaxID=3153558 RepID=UPI00325D467D
MTEPNIDPLLPEDPRVLGGYRTLGRLGAGGMGVVYLGLGPDGRQVAIKVIRREFAADPGYRARFETEVANARRVASFCTAAVLAYGEQEGMPFLVTEFVQGVSLKEYVEKHGAFPAAQLRGLVIGIGTALLAIHTARLVHRDLKPHNVLLAEDGPRVIDFGIARATDSASQHTATGVVVGSPGWIAPEQLFEGKVSTAGDIFAWGSLVAYAATGRHPYGTGNMMVLAVRAQQGAHDLSGVPGDLLPLVEAALDPDPSRRPTGEQILTELMGVAAEQEAHTQISSVWTPDFLPSSGRTFTGLRATQPPHPQGGTLSQGGTLPPGRTSPPAQQPSGATWVTTPGSPQQQGFTASVAAPLQPGAYPGVQQSGHTPPPFPSAPPTGRPQTGRNRWIVPASSVAAVALVVGLGGYFGRDLLAEEAPATRNPGTFDALPPGEESGSLAVPKDAAKAVNDALPTVSALYSYDYRKPASFADRDLPVQSSFLQQWTQTYWPPENLKNAKLDKQAAVLQLSSAGVISASSDRIEALVSGERKTTAEYGPIEEPVKARVRLVKEGGSWLVGDVSNVGEDQEPVKDPGALWPGSSGQALAQAASDCLGKYLTFTYEDKSLHASTVRGCLTDKALTEDLPAWQSQAVPGMTFHGTILDTAVQTVPAPSSAPTLLLSTKTVKTPEVGSGEVYGIIWRMTMKEVNGVWRATSIERLNKFE